MPVCWIIAGPNGAGKTTFALEYLPQVFIEGGRVMTITSAPPSREAQAMLKALQAAVANNLEKKQKLGQYAVIWQNGRPVQAGADAPKA